jgi:hypothetical protein
MENKEHSGNIMGAQTGIASQVADTYKNPLGHAPIGRLMLQFS